jgi:hypothetical protein
MLLACPRVAPDWELAALRALMKPQTRGAIANRKALQAWPRNARVMLEEIRETVASRIGFDAELKFPLEGDYFLVADVARAACEEAKGFALAASARFPEMWFVLGRTFIKGGRFYRRERGIKLNLVPATNVHLTRAIRAALRDLL